MDTGSFLKGWVSVEGTRAILGMAKGECKPVSASFIRRMIRKGRIRAVRIGHAYLVNEASARAWKPGRPGRPSNENLTNAK